MTAPKAELKAGCKRRFPRSETKEVIEVTPPRPLRKRIERSAGRVGLRLVVGPLRALPLPVGRAIGCGLGSLLYTTLGRYRRVAHKNLTLVYGDEKSASRTNAHGESGLPALRGGGRRVPQIAATLAARNWTRSSP